MSPAAWLTLAVLIGMILVLVREYLDIAAAMVGAVGLLLVFGVLTPERALAGLASPAAAFVGLFSLLVLPLSRSGFLARVSAWLFHRSQLPPPVAAHSVRALAPVVFLSAFVANTQVVASVIPTVRPWARRNGVVPECPRVRKLARKCDSPGTKAKLEVSRGRPHVCLALASRLVFRGLRIPVTLKITSKDLHG